MTLGELLQSYPGSGTQPETSAARRMPRCRASTYDSRQARPGSVFVALRGAAYRRHVVRAARR